MSKSAHVIVLDLLKKRDGEATDVTLADGRTVRIYNIAWGYDAGDSVAHITTNISPPDPKERLPIDFFFADQVVRLTDPENGAIWFDQAVPEN